MHLNDLHSAHATHSSCPGGRHAAERTGRVCSMGRMRTDGLHPCSLCCWKNPLAEGMAGNEEKPCVSKKNQFTSNFCLSSSFPSSPSGGTGTLKYSPSSWLSSLNLEGENEILKSGRQAGPWAGPHLLLQSTALPLLYLPQVALTQA